MDAELRPVLAALAALEPRIVQYKACSTADSSPTIGSLGRVIELGREHVSASARAVLFAQPDFGRYTVFGHHFAAEDGIVYRLDRQPTMSTHPSTPMTESDLAVHLARQTDAADRVASRSPRTIDRAATALLRERRCRASCSTRVDDDAPVDDRRRVGRPACAGLRDRLGRALSHAHRRGRTRGRARAADSTAGARARCSSCRAAARPRRAGRRMPRRRPAGSSLPLPLDGR